MLARSAARVARAGLGRVCRAEFAVAASTPPPSQLEQLKTYIAEEPEAAAASISKALEGPDPSKAVAGTLKAFAAASQAPPPLTSGQAAIVMVAAGLPAVGFGFTDNVIMILAGEEIDASLGVMFGLSTMAAAGLGNMVSDVAGVQLESFIERTAGVKEPPLTAAQRRSGRYRTSRGFGKTVGIMVGCLLGMVPLLIVLPKWLKAKVDAAKASVGLATPAATVHRIVAEKCKHYMDTVAEMDGLLAADSVTLFVVDPDSRDLFSLVTGDAAPPSSGHAVHPRLRRLVVPRSDAGHPLQLVSRLRTGMYTTDLAHDAVQWATKYKDQLPQAVKPAVPHVETAWEAADVFSPGPNDAQYTLAAYEGRQTAYFLPLFDEQHAPIGVLQVLRETGDRFSPAELHMASAVGSHAASAVRALLAFRANAVSEANIATGETVKEEAAGAEYDLPAAFGILKANAGVGKVV